MKNNNNIKIIKLRVGCDTVLAEEVQGGGQPAQVRALREVRRAQGQVTRALREVRRAQGQVTRALREV